MTANPVTPAKIIDLSPEEFVNQSLPIRLIDVRSRFEYNRLHAPTALNLSLPRILMSQFPIFRHWVLPPWLMDLPQDQPIGVICLTAHRSSIAATQLVKLGFTQVFNITGGMMAWQQAQLPTQTA